MAALKTGDRVKVVAFDTSKPHEGRVFVGMTGVILCEYRAHRRANPYGKFDWAVLLDDGTEIPFFAWELSPIKPLPCAADILAMEGLPNFDCPIPAEAA